MGTEQRTLRPDVPAAARFVKAALGSKGSKRKAGGGGGEAQHWTAPAEEEEVAAGEEGGRARGK